MIIIRLLQQAMFFCLYLQKFYFEIKNILYYLLSHCFNSVIHSPPPNLGQRNQEIIFLALQQSHNKENGQIQSISGCIKLCSFTSQLSKKKPISCFIVSVQTCDTWTDCIWVHADNSNLVCHHRYLKNVRITHNNDHDFGLKLSLTFWGCLPLCDWMRPLLLTRLKEEGQALDYIQNVVV